MVVSKGLHILALAGGVGGAKLAYGLSQILGDRLTVLVNTGDDFEHLGLQISPDIDTITHTLASIANPELGWGLSGETWSFLGQLGRISKGSDWIKLGDKDLATYILRTEWLRHGKSLTEFTDHLRTALGIKSRIVPMSDDPVRTQIHTQSEQLPFQEYFVRLKCEPKIVRISYDNASSARQPKFLDQFLNQSGPLGIVICPSNPYLSIDPILAIPGLKERMLDASATVVGVSPIVGGQAIKGPTAKIMKELGHEASALAVARHYSDLLDGFIIDAVDIQSATEIRELDMEVLIAETVMRTNDDRIALASTTLAMIDRLIAERAR